MSLSFPTPPSSLRRAVHCAPWRRRIAFVALIQCCIAAPAWSSHIGEDLTLDRQAVAVTDQMLGAMRQYEAAAPAQRANALARLTELATQRRERMLALLQRNPGLVSSRVLPAELRSRLPAQVQAQMERDVATSGVINARIEDDFPGGRSNQRFELVDATGEHLELSVPDASENELLAMAGKRVRAAGVQFDRHLLVHDKGRLQLEAAGGTTSGSGGTVVAATLIQGNQNTLSILVNFSDAAVTCNATDVASRLFGATGSTVNNNYRESSGGLVGFSGQVVGPYTINYSASGSCDYLGWGSAAESAARAAGVDPSKYSRVNYVTPRNSTCGWSGLAYMPGRTSWVQSCGSTGVFSHELGHNLSFHHAATPSSEYGDGSDPMGGARVVNLNAANRVMAGWTSGSAVSDVTTGGSYALSTISSATATSSPQVLRIVKPDTREYYYISLREAVGLDAGLAATFINTVSVHRSTGTLPSKTYLLQNLAAGQTFTDSVNGITIANQAVSNSTATVAVTLGASACVRNAPTVAIAPASQTAAAGTTLAYTVSVTNRNSAACGTSTFALTQALPAGLSGSLGVASLAIASGASASTTWSVTSSTAAADATYTLTASAADSATAVGTAAHASFVVYSSATSCTRSAPSIVVSPSSQSAGAGSTLPYTVTITNRDSSACGTANFALAGALPAGFSGAFAAANLAVPAGGSASTSWSVTSTSTISGGTYMLGATTAEPTAGLSASASASAVISSPDATPPSLTITSPSAGATLTGNKASIAASASDASGVQAVEFYVDGVLLARDTSAPYAANWNVRRAGTGSHSIRVRAIDTRGNAVEKTITVTVSR